METKPRRFRNWGRTVDVQTSGLLRPASEAEVLALVRRARAEGRRLKPVGAGHSWSEAAATDGWQVSLDALDRLVAVAPDRTWVEVEGGVRLRVLNERLAERGLALPVVGSIAAQSVAGAVSTGTHGSAPGLGSLSSLVQRLWLACGDGELRELGPEHGDDFQAARLGLGALGIFVRLRITVVPAFRLEELSEPVPFDEAVALVPRLAAEERFAKLWWLPHTGRVQVSRYRPTDAPSTFSRAWRWFDEKVINGLVFTWLLWLGARRPRWVPALNRLIGGAYFKPVRGVARSDRALNLAMPPVHEEVEYALPLEAAPEALRWVEAMIERERLCVNFVFEVRFVAAEEALLSPAFGRATCYLGAYMARAEGIDRYFALFERRMLELGGRPHWGKQFSATAEEVARVHANLGRFDAVRRRFDPDGVFANRFLERVWPRAERPNSLEVANDPSMGARTAG
jgi:L-gulonolactone oxidase